MIPRAVLYFTGEAFEDDDDFEDCDSEGGDEDTEEEDGDHWRKLRLAGWGREGGGGNHFAFQYLVIFHCRQGFIW